MKSSLWHALLAYLWCNQSLLMNGLCVGWIAMEPSLHSYTFIVLLSSSFIVNRFVSPFIWKHDMELMLRQPFQETPCLQVRCSHGYAKRKVVGCLATLCSASYLLLQPFEADGVNTLWVWGWLWLTYSIPNESWCTRSGPGFCGEAEEVLPTHHYGSPPHIPHQGVGFIFIRCTHKAWLLT